MTLKADRTEAIRTLYEHFPYPSPIAGDMLIADVSNVVQCIASEEYYNGRHVLDAGCGTGHRLLAVAKALPGARFTGVDLCERSIETAKELARRHAVSNVNFFIHDLRYPLQASYDIVVSTGVITCIYDPELAVRHLLKSVAADGFVLLWVYHPYGEFSRLLDRRLAMLFTEPLGNESIRDSLETLRRLQLSLPLDQYGTTTSKQRTESDRASIDVDAYLNPVVNVFTFCEIFALLQKCGAEWVAPNGLNWRGRSKLIDLGSTLPDPYFAIAPRDFLRDQQYQDAFSSFSVLKQLMAIELAIKPTGITVLAGRGRSYLKLDPRIVHNVIEDATFPSSPVSTRW